MSMRIQRQATIVRLEHRGVQIQIGETTLTIPLSLHEEMDLRRRVGASMNLVNQDLAEPPRVTLAIEL